jgi:ferredoxin/flavodoxin---NADP+ reductase
MTDKEVYDLTIIGAGPTGLFSAFYAGLRGMKTKIVESLPEVGGQLTVLYPEKYIYDVPGFPKVLAKDLVPLLVEQCKLFEPTYVFEERIETLTRATPDGTDEEVWRLGSHNNNAHFTKTVLVTAGIGAFAPNKLDRPGVDEFEGKGVFYFVKDKRPFRNKKILIVGGGDTAFDWALNLKDWASGIEMIHRRDEFRAHESTIAAVHASGIQMSTFWELKRVTGNGNVQGATIYNNKTGEERDLDIDIVLITIGFKASLGPIEGWGLEQADVRHLLVDGFMETNLPGVFAAGDIASVEGSEPMNLIVTGFGQGAIAANAAKRYVDPKSRLFPGHSSELRL